MNNQVQTAKDQITKILSDAFEKSGLMEDCTSIEINIETPKDLSFGDFSSNVAMQTAKSLKMPPRQIAEKLIAAAETEGTYIEKIEIAGPGFINFTLSAQWFCDVNKIINDALDNYGRITIGSGKKVMVEFVSANPTGPMHMGNARGGALGDCLANVLDFAGYDCCKEFYVNDAGNQIEKFGNSLEARYLQTILGEDKVEFPEDGYHGDDIKEHAQNFAKEHGDAFANVPSDERKKALTEYALPKNMAKIKADMEKYRIEFDNWFCESELYKSGEVDETIALLKNNSLTYVKEGALWFKSTEFGCEKDDVLVRANGIPTYLAADIAYHRNKFITRGFDTVINVWGADHHGHIARMKGAMEALSINPDRLRVIVMQLVRLMQNGETVRMSKRSGKAITLSDLLDETSIDAARFFFNLRQAASHFDFDLDLAISKSSDNPVYYVQYAHARICSILKLLSDEGVVVNSAEVRTQLLDKAEEIELMRHLCYFPEEIKICAETMDPSRLTHYVMKLASLFHSFYNACRVRCEDEELMKARTLLCKSVQITMKNVLTIIGVEAPEKM